MPSVTGPVSCSLIGVRRPATAPRKARSPTNGSPSMPDRGERRAWIEHRVVELERPVGEHLARRRCPTRPGRSCAPCRSGSAATAPPGGEAGARGRRWPRRADPCAAGCRSSWPHRAEGRSRSPSLVLPSHAFPLVCVTPRMATGDARGQISACHARPPRPLARPRQLGAAAPADGPRARGRPRATTASPSPARAPCWPGGPGSACSSPCSSRAR